MALVDSEGSAGTPAGPAGEPQARRAWVGPGPALASGFVARPETGHALETALAPGTAVALVSENFSQEARSWQDSCGKTQLAVAFAQSLWQAAAVDLVIWVNATSRAAVLASYAEAAAALDIQLSGEAETVSNRFLGWLRDTPRPWLVVLDDLTAAAGVDERLWPAGRAGRVVVTTSDAETLRGRGAHAVPVGPFSRREALTYLIGRLTADLDQRQGAIDLVGELGNEPMALAMASAVIASSELTCHDYREHFLRRRDQVRAASRAGQPAAGAITWALAMDHAELLSPGAAHSLLVLAALLDGNGMPSTVFGTSAARDYLAYSTAGGFAGGPTVPDGLAALEHAGLLTADPATAPPMLQMSWLVQATVRAAMPARMLKGAAAAAADAVLEAWPADDSPQWLARSLRSCTDSLRLAAGDLLWEGSCHAVLLRAGRSLDAARLTGPAVSYWEDLAATSPRLLGPDHPATFEINERLARAYLAAGRPAEAISLLQWVRDERARRLGQDHPSTVEASRDLGLALVSAGRYDDAVIVLSEAASGCERSQGPEQCHGRVRARRRRRRLPGRGPVRRRGHVVQALARGPRASSGCPASGRHGEPPEAGRGIPGRRPGQGRDLAV